MDDRQVSTMPKIRRVITAQTEDGANVFAFDEQVEPLVADGSHSEAGQTVWQIWGSDGVPQLPLGPDATYANTLFAPTGGYRIQICEFPARDERPREPQGTWPPLGTRIFRPETGEAGGEFGGGDYSRLHFTDSVDLMLVLEGEVDFRVGDGTEKTLRGGDVLINSGASHSWRRGSVPCRIAMIALGANRVGD